MAWLESKGNVFRIRFRFGGRKQLHALSTTSEREANEMLARFEANTRLIDQGIIDAPPDEAELGTYILSGGKLCTRPSTTVMPVRATLRSLFESYLRDFPRGSKEANTWETEKLHIRHLQRVLNPTLLLAQVATPTLQNYIDTRSKEFSKRKKTVSQQTIRKEIGTLSTIWNKWAIPQGLISTRLPTASLNYPKGRSRSPFQTRDQIERQIIHQKLSHETQLELWECLFLTLPEVDEVLDYVRNNSDNALAYPMFVFAAHTGARISEMRRSLRSDIDFEGKTIIIREKKKDTCKQLTYRSVPMTPLLESTLRSWFSVPSDGCHTFCISSGHAMRSDHAMRRFRNGVKHSRWNAMSGWHCFRHSFILLAA